MQSLERIGLMRTINTSVGLSERVQLKAARARSAFAILCGPTSISNRGLAVRLAESPLFREFQRAFEIATALPLTLRAAESWQLAHTQIAPQNGCTAISGLTPISAWWPTI